ncbi:MAG: hypothetical protein J6333_02925 [Planctomycetes bacterium]|nr:hypothetical protein [Planctomycetota bacterium]
MDNLSDALNEAFEVHDRFQIEMKFSYPLDPAQEVNTYHVDTYFFLPKNLFINRLTYKRDDFFNDLQRYIRLKTPAYLLRVIDDGDNCPLKKLSRAMDRLATGGGEAQRRSYHERLKMFCSIMKSALRDEESFLEREAARSQLPTLIDRYLTSTASILSQYRELRLVLQAPSVSADDRELFALVDEFLSVTANRYRYRLWKSLEGMAGEPWAVAVRRAIAAACGYEIGYRRDNGYPSVPTADGDNEEFVYREGVLKKIMAGVLFLRTSTRRDGVLLENVLFGIAAGVAMTFATGVAFLSKSLFLQEFSATFFVILVVAYMWKDRIKEWLRSYFASRLRRVIYDYRTTVFSELGREVGVCKESFSFLREADLEPRVVALRNRSFLSLMENGELGEDIILARREVRLRSADCAHLFADFDVRGVVDIMRFNVRRFLEKMDNPKKEIPMPAPDGGLCAVKAKRVYHVNVILRCHAPGQPDAWHRFRLVLNRNGIQRLEPIA